MAYLKAVHAANTDDPDAVMKKLKELPIAESKSPWDYYHIKAVVPGNDALLKK